MTDERIKELAEQAGLKHHNWITNESNVKDGDFKYPRLEDYEKFAELIVQECIDYCGENLSKTVGGALKIHFGVELDVNETLRNRSTYFGNDI